MSQQSSTFGSLSNGNNASSKASTSSSESRNAAIYPHIKDLQAKARSVLRDYGPYTPMGKLLDCADEAARRVSTDVSFKRPDRAYVEHLVSQEILVNIIPSHKDFVALNAHRGEWKRRHSALCQANDARTPMMKQISEMIIEDNARSGVVPQQDLTQRVGGVSSKDGKESPRPLSMPSTPTIYKGNHDELFLNGTEHGSKVPSPTTGHPPASPKIDQRSPGRREKPIIQPKPANLRAHPAHPHQQPGGAPNADDQVAQRFARLKIQRHKDDDPVSPELSSASLPSSPTTSQPFTSSQGSDQSPTSNSRLVQHPGSGRSATKPMGPRSMPVFAESPPRPPKLPLSPGLGDTNASHGHSAQYVSIDRREASIPAPRSPQNGGARPDERLSRSPKRISEPISMTNGVQVPSRSSSMRPPQTAITAAELHTLFKRASVLLIDVRNRDLFDDGHLYAKNIICIEPVGFRSGMSAAELEDRLISSPTSEQALFEQLDRFDFVVYYDQSTSNDNFLQGPPLRTEANHLRALHDTLFEYNDHRPLRKRPIVLLGGIDAWADLVGPQALAASETTTAGNVENVKRRNAVSRKPIGRLSSVSANSSLEVRKRRLREQRPLNADEERSWLQKAQSEIVKPSTGSKDSSDAEYEGEVNGADQSPIFVRSYEEFLRRFPEPNNIHQPLSLTPVPRKDPPAIPPPPPPVAVPEVLSRPPPTVARPSYGGVSESKYSQYPSISRQTSAKQQPIYFSRTSSKYRKLPRTGLINFGVTCYMNATIQCLLATIPLSSFFLGEEWRKYVRKNWKGSNGILPEYFANLIRSLWADDSRPIRPSSLRSFCARLKDEWGIDRQQDAKEFFDFLVDCLHEDLNVNFEEKPQPPLTEQEELMHEDWPMPKAAQWEWSRYLTREASFISDLFAGQHASRLRCTTCNRTSTTYEPFYSISVEIPPSNPKRGMWDIHSCLRSYCREEDLSGDEVWKCPHCKREREATKQITITRAPQFLVIHFKRFEMKRGNAKKVHTAINFPLRGLDIGNYMAPETPTRGSNLDAAVDSATTAPFVYDCYAVMRHIGKTGEGGHYISLIRDSVRNCWRKFDDDRVTDFDPAKLKDSKALQNEEAYLLFYGRAIPR